MLMPVFSFHNHSLREIKNAFIDAAQHNESGLSVFLIVTVENHPSTFTESGQPMTK